jgi:ketosteroid isomerase-like protein
MPATGRSFSVAGAKFTQVRNGEIVSATLYWNMADLLTQVGVLPPPQTQAAT